MQQFGYGEHIAQTVESLPYEAVIQTEEIALRLAEQFALPYDKARAATNVKLKRMADGGEIKRLHKGVYCHVKETAFGRTTPDIDKLMARTLLIKDGRRIGYESGPSILNRLGLSTLLPRMIELTTNDCGIKLPAGCQIELKKPRTEVTDENWKYLQFLDVVDSLRCGHTDAEKPNQILLEFVRKENIDALTLVFTARRLYAQRTVLQVVDLLMEGKNEPASR